MVMINHLSLNIDKTKELVVDYRKQSREHTPITIDKTPVERVSSFKFLSHHRGSHMVCSHRCSAEEGTSASLLPETAEEVWNEAQNPKILLHLHCGEHPDRLHHRLVWKQHRWQPQGSAKGRANCPPHCLEVSFPPSRTSTPGGVQGKPRGLSKTPATRPTDCSLCCPQGDVSAAYDPALAD